MRIATYNVEWFNSLFDDANKLVRSQEWSARYNVTKSQQADALACVFQAMDADVVMIIEAPDTGGTRNVVQALENFAKVYGLRTHRAISGFANNTRQEIAALYDPAVVDLDHAPRAGTQDVPRFDGVFSIDLDIDATKDEVQFSKPPFEIRARTSSGAVFNLIGVHLKSKAPHGARSSDEEKRMGIANRRKQLAQAIWLRARVDQMLDESQSLIVLGDLNDGPGLDAFEHLFGRSSVEIVLGDDRQKRLVDPHATYALSQRFGGVPTTARFWNKTDKRYFQALLDYVMLSPDLAAKEPVWRIWHPLDDPICWNDPDLRQALVTASDHFPVSVDLSI
ncbi:MAG: endonuclease/exonuclease/phosphatase family protein [Roseobacter sp.]